MSTHRKFISMKSIKPLQVVLFVCMLGSVSLGQDKDKIQVSPNIVADLRADSCENLNIGAAAISTPPRYPTEAKSARVGGTVKVKVQIDEKGNVAEILNVDGHKLLKETAASAASKIKFSPTMCDGIAKSVMGLVTYNFNPYVFTESYFVPETIEDFTDINADSDFYESVLYLTENYKLAFGYRDKRFHPSAPITKGEFAHFLRTTLDLLSRRAELANKNPKEIGLFTSLNLFQIKTFEEIDDVQIDQPYAESVSLLVSNYDIALVNENKQFAGKLPLTQNEIIDYWMKIFGKDALPVNFERIKDGDRIFSRGEFALFLQESLYVLTYKVLP